MTDFEWLEELESERARAWVDAQNVRTETLLSSLSTYRTFYEQACEFLGSQQRLPFRYVFADWVYDLEVSEANPLGIWRRCHIKKFSKKESAWEELLDLDAHAQVRGQDWTYSSVDFSPSGRRALLSLSDQGSDAHWVREFDLHDRTFVEAGFEIPLSKSIFAWIDEETICVGGESAESLNFAGLTKSLSIWERGGARSSPLLCGEDHGVGLGIEVLSTKEGLILIQNFLNFDEAEFFLWSKEIGLKKIPLPPCAHSIEVDEKSFYFSLARDFESFQAGDLLKADRFDILSLRPSKFQRLWQASADEVLQGMWFSRGHIYIHITRQVRSQLLVIHEGLGRTLKRSLPLPLGLEVWAGMRDKETGDLYFLLNSFVDALSLWRLEGDELVKIRESGVGSSKDYFVVQDWVISSDGVQVPYFLVRRRDLPIKKEMPLLLYGYGGFEVSLLPWYDPAAVWLWLERGGAYAVANIRGGGELGPQWSLGARKENKQKSYDDFIAVAEALVAQGVTCPSKMGILGASNGGLLVGAVTMQRPDLFGAVGCLVPLLDMLRYAELPPGAIWKDEFGDPADPIFREVLLKYSPYHNIPPAQELPKIFFMTSKKDDRVHPGHARKMAARLQEQGHSCLFYEEMSGGHVGGGLSVEAKQKAMLYSFFWNQLGEESTKVEFV